jgi:hypothetical protein
MTSPTNHKYVYITPKKEGLFPLGIGLKPNEYTLIASSSQDLESLKWHHRMGHLNIQYLLKMQ